MVSRASGARQRRAERIGVDDEPFRSEGEHVVFEGDEMAGTSSGVVERGACLVDRLTKVGTGHGRLKFRPEQLYQAFTVHSVVGRQRQDLEECSWLPPPPRLRRHRARPDTRDESA